MKYCTIFGTDCNLVWWITMGFMVLDPVYGELVIFTWKRQLGLTCLRWLASLPCSAMKDLLILLAHLLTTIAKLLGPGGAKTIVADSLLMKQQLLIMNRTRRRAPNLSVVDRFLLGFWSLFLSPRHIQRAAVIIRPSTLLKLHRLLKQRKYRLLYSAPQRQTWPERPFTWTHPGDRRTKTTQPTVRLSTHRSTDQQGVRHRYW